VLEPGGNLVTPQTFKVVPSIHRIWPAKWTGWNVGPRSAVTFGGVKATSFTVNSDIQITATVPTAAKTGPIKITTKGGECCQFDQIYRELRAAIVSHR
jgi:hypothetical protein